MAINYSDGESIESRVRGLLAATTDLGSGTDIARAHYDEWAVRYHLSSERGNLLKPLRFDGLNVIEVGAGMGGISRIIAECARSLHLIEGTPERLEGAKLRLRDLSNWTGEVGAISDCQPRQIYDVAAVIGVLEYAERFVPEPSAHAAFLEKVSRFLRPDGVVVIAIENACGLKYWGGAAEDHNGMLFDGIVGYSERRGAKTFSKQNLTHLLSNAGFDHIQFFYPFPDYKIPSCLLTDRLIDLAPETAASLASHRSYDNYCTPRVRYFPDSLSTMAAARNGLLAALSNSFLVVACRNTQSAIWDQLVPPSNQVGWHFGKIPTVFEEQPSGCIVVSRNLVSEPLIPGEPLRFELARAAYFGEWDVFLERLRHFLQWSQKTHGDPAGLMLSKSIDAIFLNAIRHGDDYRLFDWEWKHAEAVPQHWFVFRNAFACIRDLDCMSSKAPFQSLAALYEVLCHSLGIEPKLEQALGLEAEFQAKASGHGSVEFHHFELTQLMHHSFPDTPFPRNPTLEFDRNQRLTRVEAENQAMRLFLNRRSVRLARNAARVIKRFTGSHERPTAQ